MSMPPLPPPKPALDPHARAFVTFAPGSFEAGDVLHIEGGVRFMRFYGSISAVGVVRGLDAWLVSNERRKAR